MWKQPRGNNLVPPQQNGDGNDRPFKCPDCGNTEFSVDELHFVILLVLQG